MVFFIEKLEMGTLDVSYSQILKSEIGNRQYLNNIYI